MTRLWHPFSDLHALETDGPLVIERGDGVYVFDEHGNRYLDATASLWYCNVGFGRTEIADAASAQMRELAAYSTFGDLSNRAAEELAERVGAIAPFADGRIFFTSGGSDSIDTATKMVRRYWQLSGSPERTALISREHAYHGMHLAGTSLAGIDANVAGHGALMQDVHRVRWDDPSALRDALDSLGPERVAAFFCEPVIGAGGVFVAPQGYLHQVREICRDAGVLFVADEVITGFGRVGDWFASSRFDLDPDLVVCAKGITSGYLPMGAVVASPRVWSAFADPAAGMWRHGYTYSGHATVAAVALANLDILEREDLPGRTRRMEKILADTLAPLASHGLVDEVRAGTGMLAAVQLSREALSSDAMLPARTVAAARSAGIMTRTLATGALQISPALTISEEQLDELASGLGSALDVVAANGARRA